MGRLKGKRAIVLGASSKDNMGQHIARRFIAEGARVLVSGRKADVLAAFAASPGSSPLGQSMTNNGFVAAVSAQTGQGSSAVFNSVTAQQPVLAATPPSGPGAASSSSSLSGEFAVVVVVVKEGGGSNSVFRVGVWMSIARN